MKPRHSAAVCGIQPTFSAFCALFLLVPLAACSSGSQPLLEPAAPRISLWTAPDSDIQPEELELSLSQDEAGWLLSLESRARDENSSLLLQVELPEDWQASEVQQFCTPGELNLLVADAPGVIALGVIMPAGGHIEPGQLLGARLQPVAAGSLRSTRAVPQGSRGQVTDLRVLTEGEDAGKLAWSYVNRGDYDQNSEANIADLTPLSTRLGERTDDGELDELDSVLDGDGNGEVNLADITVLGQNFLNRVSAYRVYGADGTDPELATSTLLQELPYSAGSTMPQGRRSYVVDEPAGVILSGGYVYVRAWEESADEEGAASNVIQLAELDPSIYRLPPAQDWLVDAGQCLSPSLLLLHPWLGLSDEDAPVIVYTRVEAQEPVAPLMLSYYGEAGWTEQEIGDAGNYSNPMAVLTTGPEVAPQSVVLAYRIDTLGLVARYYDPQWNLLEERAVPGGNGVMTQLKLDRDTDGSLGAVSAWQDGNSGSVLYSWTDGDGNWNSQTVFEGTTISGVDFAFDPAGGDPWLVFTDGTINTDQTLLLDFSMQQGRLNGGTWTLSPIPHPDSPLAVDIGFRADNTPQLAFSAARDYTVEIPFQDPITLSLLVDVNTAEYNGSSWDIQRAFESTLGVTIDAFPPTAIILTLDMAPGAVWARADELLYNSVTGEVEVDLATQLPQDGALSSDSQYMLRSGGHAYNNSNYYGGSSGRAHSWGQPILSGPSCAYLRSTDLQVTDLLAGNFSASGELAYWRP